jgi:hypothetical protein
MISGYDTKQIYYNQTFCPIVSVEEFSNTIPASLVKIYVVASEL